MEVQKAQFIPLSKTPDYIQQTNNLDILDNLDITLEAFLGKTNLKISEVRKFYPGYIFQLDKESTNITVDIIAGGKKIATGEIMVLDDKLGIKIATIEKENKN